MQLYLQTPPKIFQKPSCIPAMQRARVILLDAHGVLVKVKEPVARVYARRAKQHGIDLPEERTVAHFAAAFAQAPPLAPGASCRLPGIANTAEAAQRINRANAHVGDDPDMDQLMRFERSWWRRLVADVCTRADVGADERSFQRFFEDVYSDFSKADAWELYPDVSPFLSSLDDKNYRVAVVSNFDTRLIPILDGLGILSKFSSVSLSTWCGTAKPRPEIFLDALENIAVRAENLCDVVHVGDDMALDVIGAHSVGLRPVLLDRKGKWTQEGLSTFCKERNILQPRLISSLDTFFPLENVELDNR